ncbi:hydantoinase/oxoprolinase family protein [soil metagenome]
MSTQTDRHGLSVSADVGGTFTDVVILDVVTGMVTIGKSPTVANSPVDGIVNALETMGISLGEMEQFFHGTTIGINTLLERRGARVGLLTTEGFRDMLAIGASNWPPFRLTWTPPEALVSRELTAEVNERIRSDGTVLAPLDEDGVIHCARALVDAGAEVIAISFINSYIAPKHERRAGELVAAHFPGIPVVLSHHITRRYREFPRTATAVGEAYLRPRMQRYFDELRAGLRDRDFSGRLFITSSDGGVMGMDLARDRALRTLVSGCASGIAGAAAVAARSGWNDIVAIDMGGTSFDAAIIQNGHPAMSSTAEVAGHSFLIPMLDLATIGAGGGSIASVDSVGSLAVGPRSAGAAPGPVCYGRGGVEPTFTDAALVSGLLPTELLGGRMSLSLEGATAAVARHVAGPLGMGVDDAAAGIIAIVEAKMAQLLEEMTIGRGLDPRDFTIFAYGGGGPLVAARMAEELGCRQVVIPPHPGVFSAWGMQTLDAVQEFSRTLIVDPHGRSAAELADPFVAMIDEAVSTLSLDGFDGDELTLLRFVEMRYESQEHTLLVPFNDAGAERLRDVFERAHENAFGFTVPGDVQIVTYRLRAVGALPKPVGIAATVVRGTADSPPRSRAVYERATRSRSDWPVVDRDTVPIDVPLTGPVIVEERNCTVVVPRGWNVLTDKEGSLVMSR